jgi:hypothetical protein
VARKILPPEQREPAILRLQLELKLDRKSAEACVLAGYLSAAAIATAHDDEFHEVVRLPPKRRAELLAMARRPGSRPLEAGPAPASLRDASLRPVIVRAVGPLRKTMTKALGEPPAQPPARPSGPRPAPPHMDPEEARKKARRRGSEEAEAAVDEELAKGG